MTVQLSSEARARVDGHLDAVERVLVEAGKTREQRRAVMDDLEAQILEMLGAKSELPGVAEVEGVLTELDLPEAYAASGDDQRGRPAAQAPVAIKPVPAEKSSAGPTITRRRNFMKPSILIALIVCGTVLVMTPAAFDYFNERLTVELMMSRPEVTSVISPNLMRSESRFGFWVTGTAAIGFGVIGGFMLFARESRQG